VSLCAPDERGELRDIERLLRRALPVADGNHLAGNAPLSAPEPQRQHQHHRGRSQGRGGHQPRNNRRYAA
jgi:ATP-dependent RNA helicase RhlE